VEVVVGVVVDVEDAVAVEADYLAVEAEVEAVVEVEAVEKADYLAVEEEDVAHLEAVVPVRGSPVKEPQATQHEILRRIFS